MKKIIIALVAVLLPLAAFGAYNDVTLTTDTDVSINSITLDVSGSSAAVESIVVNAGNFVVTLPPGASITVTSSGGKDLTTDANPQFVTKTCSGGTSSAAISVPASKTATETVTVTVTAASCSSGSTTSTSDGGGGVILQSGGGGGGGGSSYAPVAVTQTAPAAAPQVTVSVEASASASIPAVTVTLIQKTLKKGVSGGDVKNLQKILNSDPETKVAESGAGSPGNETTLFGAATMKAVQKFQVKYGLAKEGESGYGIVGPKTRAKLNELAGSGLASAVSSTVIPDKKNTGQTLGRPLKKGSSGEDVTTLQQILNSDPETKVAESGAGSPGNETTLFGAATMKAVQKFQVKYGLAKEGESGYGIVGPKTRAKLNELLSGSSGSMNGNNTVPANESIEKQLNDALQQLKNLQSQMGN